MTEESDEAVPLLPEIQEVVDRAVASVPRRHPPQMAQPSRSAQARRRFIAYPILAAAIVATVAIGMALLDTSDPTNTTTVPTARAAAPIPSAVPGTSPPPGAADGSFEEQLVADAAIAADHGLTLGMEVESASGEVVLEDQPDLIAVAPEGVLRGYALRDEVFAELVDPGAVISGYYVYAADGSTIRGVFDLTEGYTPIEEDPSPPSREGGG